MSMWRTKGRGKRAKHIPIRQGTAFGPAENQKLAEEVHAQSPEDARASANLLDRDFMEAKTRDHRKEIWHATELEANRLGISAHDMRNGPAARASLAERSRVFRDEADRMHNMLVAEGAFEYEK